MEADSRVGVARAGRQLPAPPAAEVERGAEHEVGVEAGQDNAASREQREAAPMEQPDHRSRTTLRGLRDQVASKVAAM